MLKKNRRKLTDDQRKEIRILYNSMSQKKLAKIYKVSKKLISFICFPDKHKRNIELVNENGFGKVYYNKNKHKTAMREHKKYKRGVYNIEIHLDNFDNNGGYDE